MKNAIIEISIVVLIVSLMMAVLLKVVTNLKEWEKMVDSRKTSEIKMEMFINGWRMFNGASLFDLGVTCRADGHLKFNSDYSLCDKALVEAHIAAGTFAARLGYDINLTYNDTYTDGGWIYNKNNSGTDNCNNYTYSSSPYNKGSLLKKIGNNWVITLAPCNESHFVACCREYSSLIK